MALIAVASLLVEADDGEPIIAFCRSSSVTIGNRRLEVLLHEQPARSADIEREAASRAERAATGSPAGTVITVLCAAPVVVGPRRAQLNDVEILDPDAPLGDLVDSPPHAEVTLIYASDHLEAA